MIFTILLLISVAIVMALLAPHIVSDSDNGLFCTMMIASYILLCSLFMFLTIQLRNEIVKERYQEDPSLIDKEIEKLKIEKEYFIKQKEFKKELEKLNETKDNA